MYSPLESYINRTCYIYFMSVIFGFLRIFESAESSFAISSERKVILSNLSKHSWYFMLAGEREEIPQALVKSTNEILKAQQSIAGDPVSRSSSIVRRALARRRRKCEVIIKFLRHSVGHLFRENTPFSGAARTRIAPNVRNTRGASTKSLEHRARASGHALSTHVSIAEKLARLDKWSYLAVALR